MHTGDWMLANSWIYEIHTTDHWPETEEDILNKAGRKLEATAGFCCRLDPEHPACFLSTFSYGEARWPEDGKELDEFYSLLFSEKSMVVRSQDFLESSESAGRFTADYIRPAGLGPGLFLVLCYEKKAHGLMAFYRKEGQEDFSHDDRLLLEMLSDHMAWKAGKYQEELKSGPKLSVQEAAEEYHLTRQETRILDMTMQRMSNAEIAAALSISMNTLKKHLLNIYRKLNISSRLQLFRLMKGTS